MSDNKISARDKILQAAVEEFGSKGYQDASTNNIVQRAGVSKGLIFHYFESKENLHRVCVEKGFELFVKSVEEEQALEGKDYFERMLKFAVYKIEFAYRNNSLSKMFLDARLLLNQGKAPYLTELFEKYEKDIWGRFLAEVDTSLFRDDVPTERILDYVRGILDIFARQYSDRQGTTIPDLNELMSELRELAELIKYGVYSREAGNQFSVAESLNPQAFL